MKAWPVVILGVVLVGMGAVWALQGAGVLGGSAMSGNTLWAVVGPVVAVVGLILVLLGVRIRRRAARRANSYATAASTAARRLRRNDTSPWRHL